MKFKDEFKALRKARGLTQHEAAELIGATRSAVSLWESGARTPMTDAERDAMLTREAIINQLKHG